MSKLILLLFCFFISAISREIGGAEYSCYADDPTPYRRFGTKTSYLINANLDDSEISVPGCKPVMMWFNSRHGTRSASEEEIDLMKQNWKSMRQEIVQASKDGKSKLCSKDVINLANWTPSREIWNLPEKRLGEAGRKEMRELGQRMGKRFPDLLKDSQNTVRKASPEQRTHESMKAFLMGLYGHQVDFEDSKDDMFTFNDNCPAFIKGVEKNEATKVEMNKLKESSYYKKMIAEISDRIGVQLNETQVDLAWRICRYDIAFFPDEISPWCAIFFEGDLRLIEYGANLKQYYLFGYPDIVRLMTQPLMDDLYKKFSSLKEGNENAKASVYVVHSRIAHSMLAALELYKDKEPPLASDWPNPHTTWSTSTMLSFAHNLALIALECDDPQDQFKVLAMHQERRISLSEICGEEICSLQSFLENIKSIAEADFDEVCKWPQETHT